MNILSVDPSNFLLDIIRQMFARYMLLIVTCLGLAVAPVRAGGACLESALAADCGGCCAVAEVVCCASPDLPAAPTAPATTTSSGGDAKLLMAPALVVLCAVAPPAAEPPSLHRQHAARRPAQPIIEQTCIRLL